jgi:CHAT domain-containing protein/Tfp pilus assembly protein PilF
MKAFLTAVLCIVTACGPSASDADRARIVALGDQADKLNRAGKYAEAVLMQQTAVDLAEKILGPDHPDTATIVGNLAWVYKSQGQYSKAEPLYLRALAIKEKALGPEHPLTARALNNLAELYESQSQYAKAQPLLQRALAIDEKVLGPVHPSTAASLANLAKLYWWQGQYAGAEPLFQRALVILEKATGNEHETASVLNNLGALYQSEGQHAQAEKVLQRALAIKEKGLGSEDPSVATSAVNLAAVYTSQRQYAKAEPLLQRALVTVEKALGPEHPDTATLLGYLAEMYRSRGQYSKAEPLLQRALAIDEKVLGPVHPLTAMSLNNLAILYESQSQYARAESLFVRALAIIEHVQGPDHPNATQTRDNLTILQLEAGNRAGARQTLATGWNHRLQWLDRSLRFGGEASRRNYVQDLKSQLSLLLAVQGTDLNICELGFRTVLVSKCRVLEETAAALNALKARSEPDVRDKLNGLQDLRAQRAALITTQNAANPGAKKQLLDELDRAEDKLVAELIERSLEFRALTATPEIPSLRARLGPAALVEMVEFDEVYIPKRAGEQRGPPHYGAFLLTETGDVRWRDLGYAGPIDALVRRYWNAMIVRGNQAAAQDAARQLDALVFAPIRQLLPRVRDFYVSPDGMLRLIPFVALIDTSGKPLIENYGIQTVSTGRDLALGTPVQSAQPAWVGGLAEFGQRGKGLFFPPIPGAKREAQEVAKIIRPKPQELTDSQLTKQFLMERMNGPRILHLATHGYYTVQTSGLALKDAIITSGLALKDANLGPQNILNQEEVAGLRLRGTQLVVLSACETALGEVSFADGVIGLQRSLTLAGARSQILTLWPVNDVKTKDLMVAFYRNLFEKRMTKSEALRQAQLELVHQGVDPYYWAPFVIYGDGGPLGD